MKPAGMVGVGVACCCWAWVPPARLVMGAAAPRTGASTGTAAFGAMATVVVVLLPELRVVAMGVRSWNPLRYLCSQAEGSGPTGFRV